jgi:hypothetical protein
MLPTPPGPTDGTWRELLDIARWAPSPHNTQPWLLRPRTHDRADLFMVRARRLPDEDATGCFLICGMGLFIEALRIAAANRNLRLAAAIANNPDYNRDLIPFATLTLEPGAQPDEFPDRALLERRTTRLPMSQDPLPDGAEARLAAIVAGFGHQLHIITDAPTISAILARNAQALIDDMADPKYGGEIRTWFRCTEAASRRHADGLDARCMNIPPHEMWLASRLPFLLRLPGLRQLLTASYRRKIGPAPRLALISGTFFEPSAAERAGAMLLRFWLALHEAGAGLHPFGNLITNPRAHAWLTETTGIENIWHIARFGRTAQPPRSRRLPVEDLLLAP